MAGVKVAHVVNSFDPACSVLRCVRELNRYSKYSHSLYVREPHPAQDIYQYEQPEKPGWLMSPGEVQEMMWEADAFIYHFAGRDDRHLGEYGGKPAAFRNIHVTWDEGSGKFWTNRDIDSGSYDQYRLLAASHAGALDYMPEDKFWWLPDLLPLDGAYSFSSYDRPCPRVSYIKHAEQLNSVDFGGVARLDCSLTAHRHVLSARRSLASAVIDNVCDGHYGLAGQEAAILGLPVIGFNHPRTLEAMRDWCKDGTEFPFIQAFNLAEAVAAAGYAACHSDLAYRQAIRRWSEEFFAPRRLIAEYWDPFIKELAS